MQMMMLEPLEECLARSPNSDDHWLYCDECRRFFHMSRVHNDGTGGACCPFPDCNGCGYDFNLFFWDTFREPEDPRWPSSTAELHHGMESPEMELFYAARHRHRADQLIGGFASSAEGAGLGPVEGLRFIRPFLQMLYDLSWDIDDDVGFMEELAVELPFDLPRWCESPVDADAPRMLAELRAFWAFAERASSLPHASRWRDVLVDDDVLELLRVGIVHAGRCHAEWKKQRRKKRRPRTWRTGSRASSEERG